MKINLFDIDVFNYDYVYKEVFWLFLVIPALILGHLLKEYSSKFRFKHINLSSIQSFEKGKFNPVILFKTLNYLIFLLGVSLIITALARPFNPDDIEAFKKKNIEGIDIVLAMDVSGSMLAQDFKPNRLAVAKKVALDFISERPLDRIGLVVYEGDAYTKTPLTNDHELLKQALEEIETGMVAPGTAIGVGLTTAINRLQVSEAKSKVIILLTDGVNNSGDIDPIISAQIAKEYGIRVYTIGIGREGLAPYPMKTPNGIVMQDVKVEIDEELLTEIAQITGTEYFRAKSKKELEAIYDQIDKLEKSKVRVLEFKTDPPEKYYGILAWAIILLLLSRVINHTLLKSIP